MSSYGSARSGQLHPGYQAPPQQQQGRSYSNPPYPPTPGSAPYPPQSSYFPPPPTAPYQQVPPMSNPVTIPASNRRRVSSDYAYGYGTSPAPLHSSSPYASSIPKQPLQPIPQQQPIPDNYQHSPQQQQAMMAGSPGYQHHRRRSSSSQYGYDPRQSYESAHSYQSAHSHQAHASPNYYARHSDDGHSSHDGRHNHGREYEGYGQAPLAPEAPKDYGDWDKEEVDKYHKNQALERRPTLGGSLMSFVKKIGADRR